MPLERRTPLGSGQRSLDRGSTFASPRSELQRTSPLKPSTGDRRRNSTLKTGKGFAASPAQRAKIAGRSSIVSGQGPCDVQFPPATGVQFGAESKSPGAVGAARGVAPNVGGSMQGKSTRSTVAANCAQCGAEFQARVEAGQQRGKFCSRKCSSEHLKTANLRGREVACDNCHESFYAKRGELARGKGRFCSAQCRYTAQGSPAKGATARQKISEGKRGAKNPMWRGRDTEGSIYRVFSVGLKGETCCRNCGATGLLHLHHAVPRSMCRAGRRDMRNGITLCPRCHHGWHHRLITIYRDLFTEEEWAFVSSLGLLGQNIEAWLDDRYPPRPEPRIEGRRA